MNAERWRRTFVLGSAVALVIAVLPVLRCASSPRETDGRAAGNLPASQPRREIIVKLRDEGKALQSQDDGDLLYGGERLTVFNRLLPREDLEIRQSFPKFSQRWRRDKEWRHGQRDTLAVPAVIRILDRCGDVSDSDAAELRTFVGLWERHQAVVRRDTQAVGAILRRLHGDRPVLESDSDAIASLVRRLQQNGFAGDRGGVAVPALTRLLSRCGGSITRSDSLAIRAFIHRLQVNGNVEYVSSIAIPALRRMAQGEQVTGLRDSLAVRGFLRLFEDNRARAKRDSVVSIDLFLRIRIPPDERDVPGLLRRIRAIPEVESAVLAFPDASSPAGCAEESEASSQLYLGPASEGGIDARHAWTVEGGGGDGVSVFVCDASFCDHDDLPIGSIKLVNGRPEFPAVSKSQIDHGTMTLGVLAALHDNGGLLGICPDAEFAFSTTRGEDGVRGAIDAVLKEEIEPGDVLLIEAQQDLYDLDLQSSGSLTGDVPVLLPVEANVDVRKVIAEACDEGLVVVQAAGNGREKLVKIFDADGFALWDPEEDTGAILIGAGRAGAGANARSCVVTSNYGERVDCQGWGEKVETTSCSGSTRNFRDTSSGTAMVAGAVVCFQSAHITNTKSHCSSEWLRTHLRNDKYGSAQPVGEAAVRRIGPLPDLRALLEEFDIHPVQP
jgi:hypothetical protein